MYVSERRRRLDALRSSVEVRLAALEAALADPHEAMRFSADSRSCPVA
jgi:hypothetical protein